MRNVARPRIGESAAVIGCGGVGQQVIAGLVLSGAGAIVAVDRDPAMLELSLSRGATHAVDARSGDPAAEVRALSGGGVDHAFEVVGRAETMRLAWDCLRAGGNAVVVGLAAVGVEVAFPAIEFLSDKGIKGCYYGSGNPSLELASLVQLAADGRLAAGRRGHAPDRSRRHPRGARAPAARRRRPDGRDHRRGRRGRRPERAYAGRRSRTCEMTCTTGSSNVLRT